MKPVNCEIRDTVISRSLAQPVKAVDIEPWHTVNEFAPPSHHVSPHFAFHGTWSQLERLEMALRFSQATPQEQAAAASEVLRLWQLTGSEDGADDYIDQLLDSAFAGL